MVWRHYLEESNLTETSLFSDDDNNEEDVPRNLPMEFDDWITWYSDDLMNLWSSIKTYREDSGISSFFLDHMDWNNFCEFCYQHSNRLAI